MTKAAFLFLTGRNSYAVYKRYACRVKMRECPFRLNEAMRGVARGSWLIIDAATNGDRAAAPSKRKASRPFYKAEGRAVVTACDACVPRPAWRVKRGEMAWAPAPEIVPDRAAQQLVGRDGKRGDGRPYAQGWAGLRLMVTRARSMPSARAWPGGGSAADEGVKMKAGR